jgi:hypothetical protein
MIKCHFFGWAFKQDMLAILNALKPRRTLYFYNTRPSVRCSWHWLWFAFSFERDISDSRWRDWRKETTSIEDTYQSHSIMAPAPLCFVTNLDGLREMWGEELVNQKLTEGTIKIIEGSSEQ